jgi:DNA-binding transcriptional LysR family regulator
MTLVQLRHLISLAQTGSFSQSASALFLTQPALSRSIRALEAELGQPLFDRVGRRSELTPFGRDALDRARELVLAAEDLRERARLSGDSQAGLLRVGLGSGPGAMLMTPLLLKVAQDRPRLRVQIARASTERLVQALRERDLDALVVDARSLRPAPDLKTQALHDMRGAAMKTYSIATIPGDGIGKEVILPASRCWKRSPSRQHLPLRVRDFGWGGDYYREHGVMMPADGLDAMRHKDAILFGSAGDPHIPDHITLWGLRLKICQGFDQYANVRPTRILPGIDAR